MFFQTECIVGTSGNLHEIKRWHFAQLVTSVVSATEPPMIKLDNDSMQVFLYLNIYVYLFYESGIVYIGFSLLAVGGIQWWLECFLITFSGGLMR